MCCAVAIATHRLVKEWKEWSAMGRTCFYYFAREGCDEARKPLHYLKVDLLWSFIGSRWDVTEGRWGVWVDVAVGSKVPPTLVPSTDRIDP